MLTFQMVARQDLKRILEVGFDALNSAVRDSSPRFNFFETKKLQKYTEFL